MLPRSAAFLATRLLDLARNAGPQGLIVIVAGEGMAEALGHLLGEMAPDRVCRTLPAWDCLPYDRASPSAEIMGQRMRTIHDLTVAAGGGAIVITTADAALQRLPPPAAAGDGLRIEVGQALDLPAIERHLRRLGYSATAAVDDVGHYALRGEVIDVFPAGPSPTRIVLQAERVAEIHRFDPVSQRRRKASRHSVVIGPASEIVAAPDAEAMVRTVGMEHRLAGHYPMLGTVFDLLPQARIAIESEAQARIEPLLKQIEEAHGARVAVDRRAADARPPAPAPDALYLSGAAWRRALKGRSIPFPTEVPSADTPRFSLEPKPARALRDFLSKSREGGQRVVLAASGARTLETLTTQADHALGAPPPLVTDWSAVEAAAPGSVMAMRLSADQGFVDQVARITVIAGADLLGSRAAPTHRRVVTPWHGLDGEFAFHDAVVHLDHGLGVLRSLETVDGAAGETARLDYASGADLLSPVDDLHRIWRYSAADDIPPDHLHGEGWAKRRNKIMAEIAETARELVSLAKKRSDTEAPAIVPPGADYERFCLGFPFALTPDQGRAVTDVLHDLAAGRVMDRLIVGDVGFGKTEVALRAAAAAVLAGRQVAVIAPTTVLARQHVLNFRKRFEALGIDVAHLSRLVEPDEERAVQAGLADGSIRLVVGTHALMGKAVAFHDLALLVIDEEQRFGAADKGRLRALGEAVHTLTMSATPIPRTLQSALVGLQDLSIIATPPARRRPIRTLVAPFDSATMRIALSAEHARGGQSFVVVPRIADLDRIAGALREDCPELAVVVAHGSLDPHEVDSVMVDFAEGRGDVLVATSIIESGLDVPRANTMVVVDADRFGLGQLHQLRGRVGRGRQQGICYLMTDPDRPLSEATGHRLTTLATFDRLGSGLAISAHDLDARGAGDLLGDRQAGHLKLIGVGLYQHLLQHAVREARGEPAQDWTPAIHGDGEGGHLPATYIPEAVIRLNLYARLARTADVADLDALAEEMEDRFGPLPPPAQTLLARARLKALCRSHAVERVDIGPRAVAFSLRPEVRFADILPHVPHKDRDALIIKNGRMIFSHAIEATHERLHLATRLLGDLH